MKHDSADRTGRRITVLFEAFEAIRHELSELEEWISSQRSAGAVPTDVEAVIETMRMELHDKLAVICLQMTDATSTSLAEAGMKAKAALWLLPEDGDPSIDLVRSHCEDVVRLSRQ